MITTLLSLNLNININRPNFTKKRMIIPYYNCLLIGYRYNDIAIDEQGEDLIKDYLEEYLSTPHANIKIVIKCYGQRNTNIISRMTNIVHMLLTNLSISVYQINHTYTLEERVNHYFQALKSITVNEEQAHNKPAVIDNIASLKKYHITYESQNSTKLFLKELLIKEISHQRRCIVYRKTNQIKSIITNKIQQMKGNIEITQQSESKQSQCSHLFILLVNQKSKESTKLQSLITMIKRQFVITQEVNRQITANYTLQYLRKNAMSNLESVFSSYYNLVANVTTSQILSLKNIMMTVANLKAVLNEGCRLVEQDNKLKEQFIKFVAQMNAKYTKQVGQYIIGFKQYTQYNLIKTKYFQKKKHQKKINIYFKAKIQQILFANHKNQKRNRECQMVQKVILGFLIRRRQHQNLMQRFIQQKRQIKFKYQEQYSKIIKQQNQQQLKKLQSFNRYKYGFCCCIYIIDLNNKTNSHIFSPSAITKLFQRVNKAHEVLTRIKCSQSSIEISTIEGRLFRRGSQNSQNDLKKKNQLLQANKENTQTNNSYQSIIHQFDSQSKKSSVKSSQCSSRVSLPKKEIKAAKDKCLHINGINYYFKIMQNGKLYGKGNNKYGQIGIQNQLFVPEYTPILHYEKMKIVATGDYHTIAVTTSNKMYHFGKPKGRLEGSKVPIELNLQQKLLVKQVVISHNDIYILTENNKIYSLQDQKTIRVPKQIQMPFEHFHIIRTGGLNIEMTYLLAYWINSLDLMKKQQIDRFLTQNNIKIQQIRGESMLVENHQKQTLKQIHQLSSIFEQSSF